MGQAKNPPRRAAPRGTPDALMARIDRALASWPAPGSSRLESAEKVAGIVARATEEGGGDPSDPELLRAPLPAARGEGDGLPRRMKLWLMAGGIAAATAAAVAAGTVGFAVRTLGTGQAQAPAANGRGPDNGAPSHPRATPAAPSPVDVPGIDPSELPLATGGVGGARPVPAQASALARSAAPGHPAAPTAGAPPDPAETAETPASDGLQPAAAVAAGSSLTGAAGSVPRRPSLGAIQGGLAAVLPSARACLGPGDPPYRATVTFQSDGTVRDVSAGSSAAGSPVEACIRTALARARIPPFAETAYGAPVTVRY